MSTKRLIWAFLFNKQVHHELTREQCQTLFERAAISSEYPGMPILPPPLMAEYERFSAEQLKDDITRRMERYNLKVFQKRRVVDLQEP